MAAANATIGVARAALYPTLSLDMLYGLQDTGFNMFSLPDQVLGPGSRTRHAAVRRRPAPCPSRPPPLPPIAWRLQTTGQRSWAPSRMWKTPCPSSVFSPSKPSRKGNALAAARQALNADTTPLPGRRHQFSRRRHCPGGRAAIRASQCRSAHKARPGRPRPHTRPWRRMECAKPARLQTWSFAGCQRLAATTRPPGQTARSQASPATYSAGAMSRG